MSPRQHKISELAQVLPVTTRTIRNWIKRGLIHAVKIGRAWLIPHDEFIRIGGETCATQGNVATDETCETREKGG